MQLNQLSWTAVSDGYEFDFTLQGVHSREAVRVKLALGDVKADVLYAISDALTNLVIRHGLQEDGWCTEQYVQQLMCKVAGMVQQQDLMALIEPLLRTDEASGGTRVPSLLGVRKFENGIAYAL